VGVVVATGPDTTIVKEFAKLMPDGDRLVGVGIVDYDIYLDLSSAEPQPIADAVPLDADRYVLAAGLLRPKRIWQQTDAEIRSSMAVNMLSTVQICELVLNANPNARIVVLGSESGMKGSFDTTYFLAKAALHAYVRERAIGHPGQQLVCVAPSTIGDSGMTQRRADQHNVEKLVGTLPKRRLLTANEIAATIHFLLYGAGSYISNTVIEVNGGKFARMLP
jgi:NAD(P)-dependent dehydrogenase (short-subunit alcohol dehydrogenase family)